MRVQLTWTDPNTQQVRSPTLETPIAFGREFGDMPSAMKNKAVRRMVLANEQVAPFHAIMAEAKGGLAIMNREDDHQTLVNGTVAGMQRVNEGDRITIGPFEITVAILASPTTAHHVDPFAGMAPVADPSVSNVSQPPAASPAAPPATPAVGRGIGGGMASGMAGGMAGGIGGGMAMGLAAGSTGSANLASQSGLENREGAANFFGPDGTCTHKVGFLFKRRCGRTTTQGCPDCQNGQIDPNRDRYRHDYDYYPGYGRYGRGYWGHDYYYHRHHYHYDPHSRDVDFNESDAASFAEEGDRDYEMDLDAS
ncbi:MAG: FHA domain-containing protein [Phormidesmis sp.]